MRRNKRRGVDDKEIEYEFGPIFVHQGMKVTRERIDAEEDLKGAKAKAKETGAFMENAKEGVAVR